MKSKFARSLAVAALMLVGSITHAAGLGGSITVGGGLSGFAGSVVGSASSVSEGNAVAATQVNGYGGSYQHTDGFSAGSATIGGVVNNQGAQVITGTTQVAHVNSYGSVSGNAPIEVGNGLIANGTGGLAKTTNYASGNAAFQTGAIGALGTIGGAVNIFGW